MGNFCCSPQSLSLQYHLRQFNFELVFGQLSLDFLQQLLCLLLGFCRKTFDAETPQTICVAAFSNPCTQLQFCLDRNRYRHFHPPEYLGVPGCGGAVPSTICAIAPQPLLLPRFNWTQVDTPSVADDPDSDDN